MWVVILACLLIAALTLLLPSTPTYDPWAWILWGREIAELDLNTRGGPSWKPLPIFVTVPFSLVGHDAAPYLWLWIARAGGLLACAMAFRVARRLMGTSGWFGTLAGLGAALALFSSFRFVRDASLGNSEALLAAFVLWAFERHLDGHRDHAFYLGFAAALLRPEVWPFFGLYGLWLWFSDPRLRLRIVGLGALVPVLWFLPEVWGSGDALRAGSRANNPNPGSAAFADHPALELAERSRNVVIAPVKAGFVIAAVHAGVMWVRHRREALTLAVFVGGLAWFLLVAGMTEAGFAGNQRYLIVSSAAVAVLGGIGAALVTQALGRVTLRIFGRPRTIGATAAVGTLLGVLASTPFILEKTDNTERVSGGLDHEAEVWHDLKTLIDRSGGKERLLACGGVFSGPFQVQMLAYELGIHGENIRGDQRQTPPPGILFRTRTVPNGPLVAKPLDDRFRQITRYGKWRLLSVPPERGGRGCPSADPATPTAAATGSPPFS